MNRTRFLAPRVDSMSEDNLESLLVPFRAIEAGVSIVANESGDREVRGIQCSNREATDEHLALLARLPELRAVGFEGTGVTDAATKHLLDVQFLESVDFTNTAISDASLSTFTKLPNVEFLHLERTRISAAGIQWLIGQLPGCEVVSDFT